MPRPRGRSARTGPAPKSSGRTRGRPRVHGEAWTKVTVVLFNRQIAQLDRLTADIRGRSGSALNRTEVIRALVDAMTQSGLDLTTSVSEADLRRRLIKRLTAYSS